MLFVSYTTSMVTFGWTSAEDELSKEKAMTPSFFCHETVQIGSRVGVTYDPRLCVLSRSLTYISPKTSNIFPLDPDRPRQCWP